MGTYNGIGELADFSLRLRHTMLEAVYGVTSHKLNGLILPVSKVTSGIIP